jgi:hypothetical protein
MKLLGLTYNDDLATLDLYKPQQLRSTHNIVADEASLSVGTVSRMVNGHPTSRLSVRKVLSVLSRKLGRKIEISDVEGLNITDQKG